MLCACGCGEPTTIAKRNDSRDGTRKGEPVRFVRGHGSRGKMHAVSLVGQIFANLTVPLHRAENDSSDNPQWLCRCECGREAKITGSALRSGNTKSCGNCPNRIELFGNSIVIWLNRPKSDLQVPCYIDAIDYPLVKDFYWHADSSNRTFYAVTSTSTTKIKMHQILLPQPDGLEPDHVDHNGLNNRRDNLRPASDSQNAQNRQKVERKTSSQYKGVAFSKGTKKYHAYIKINGKRKHLGCFTSEDDAAHSYNVAALELFGEFAVLNEIRNDDLILNQKPDSR
jgi:hypothetical protein